MQNAAAIVFQGEAKWGWPSLQHGATLGLFAAPVDTLHSGETLDSPLVTLYSPHHYSLVHRFFLLHQKPSSLCSLAICPCPSSEDFLNP